MKRIISLFFIFILIPGFLSALERPTVQEVKKVLDYYYKGQGQGAILIESKLCTVSPQYKGENANKCPAVAESQNFQKDAKIYLWMNFLLPYKDKAEIIIEFRRKGRVRKVSTAEIQGSTRYRIWKRIPTNKPGDWEITILQEMDNNVIELGKLTYQITD